MFRLTVATIVLLSVVILFAFFEYWHILFALGLAIVLIAIGIYDVLQRRHAVLRNFPIIGHLRYLFEFVRPEIQQYFIATNQSGRPFNRELRTLVYTRAKKVRDTIPFGTQQDIHKPGFDLIHHSLAPTVINKQESRIVIGGDDCTKPYLASRLNISAMSFGALSKNALLALNRGAKAGNFAHNTGEGGLSPYHLAGGGDIIWQIGTANFGCRNHDGSFNAEMFKQKATLDVVKMIEVKLSQGAKPAHGGILPKAKITQEIADIRGIKMGEDCVSPPVNPAFSTPKELLSFVARLRELSGGKPVGFKLCLGKRSEFLSICKAMLETKIVPDFITVDGAEGGTGAAPVEFTDYLGEPINSALCFVNNALIGIGLREKIRIIASGKIVSGMDMITKIALGADLCNSARGMMFSLGCIQALQCNSNTCPTGVTTQNPRLVRGLVVEDKYKRVANFHAATVESCLELAGAMGVNHLDELNPSHISHRVSHVETQNYADMFEAMEEGELLQAPYPEAYARDWQAAQYDKF